MEAYKIFPKALSEEECDYIASEAEKLLNID